MRASKVHCVRYDDRHKSLKTFVPCRFNVRFDCHKEIIKRLKAAMYERVQHLTSSTVFRMQMSISQSLETIVGNVVLKKCNINKETFSSEAT